MAVKDRITNWFIKNVLIPSNEVLDKPGFIITKFSDKEGRIFFRELFLPENLFEEFEKGVVEKFGEKGKKALYSIGKKFGYRYAAMSRFSTIEMVSKKSFVDFVYFFAHYVESTWAEELTHSLDYENKKIEFEMSNYQVCGENGQGYLFTEGAVAGLWAYLVDDCSVEAVQDKCQGRGDKLCHLIAAPKRNLLKENYHFFEETDLVKAKVDETYILINNIRSTQESKSSLKELIDTGKINYKAGKMFFLNERYFIIEASMVDMIENSGLPKKYSDMLFEKSFEFGKNIQIPEDKKDVSFISDFYGAAGWGDIQIFKDSGKFRLICKYFPWTERSEKSGFLLFSGLVSGTLSNIAGKKHILTKSVSDASQGYFVVEFNEK